MWYNKAILFLVPNPDKPEPRAEAKGISRKAAKDAKETFNPGF
jgi:hypothetical protein